MVISCQSDPIIINPPGGYEYVTRSFILDNSNEATQQGDQHTGHSPRLYSGYLPIADTTYKSLILIRLLPDVLDTHQICSADSISKVNVKLNSIIPLAVEDDTSITDTLIKLDALQVFLVSLPELLNEDEVLSSDDVQTISDSIQNATPIPFEIKSNNLEFQLFNHDSTIINRWCENQEDLGIVVDYSPNLDELEDEDVKYLEFISTDNAGGNYGPRLNLTYFVLEDSVFIENRYSISNVESNLTSLIHPYYISDDSSNYWGTVYAINLENGNAPILEEPLQLDSITVSEDIISDTQLDIDQPLLQIDIELNNVVLDSIDGIRFWFSNLAAFISEIDPAGDNWNEADNSGTEGNGALDWTDENNDGQWNPGEGEEWFDYGTDNCPDELENGIGGCVETEEESPYNSEGTEGNAELDWTDEDEDNLWSEGDSGEQWWDWGTDGCPDNKEGGLDEDDNPTCLDSDEADNTEDDPNGDNFIPDPAIDDWRDCGNDGFCEDDENYPGPDENGTELNNFWDSGERLEKNYKYDLGEPYHDWGSDGLPASLTGDLDEGESNGVWDEGEPFEDTGSDGLFNADEPGYNASGTEGNEEFDGEGEFMDCEVEEDEEGNKTCMDNGISDDYIIDPNLDNWSVEDSTGTEKNGVLDWTDANEDGNWDELEGEKWYDFGIDNISDDQEPFLQSFMIQPELGDNLYEIDFNSDSGGKSFEPPDLNIAEVSLWISEIEMTASNSWQIEVKVYSTRPLKALNFQLLHEPFTWTETALRTHQSSFYFLDEKLFEDYTLLSRTEYPDSLLENTIQVNYANDLSALIDFDSLKSFLENDELIFSHEYSRLVLYIDTTLTHVKEDGMFLILSANDNAEDDFIFTSVWFSATAESIEIPLAQVMQGFQNGSIGEYNGFKLITDGLRFNYSHLKILNDEDNPEKLPRIDLTFTR